MDLGRIISELRFINETRQDVLRMLHGCEKQIDEIAQIAYPSNDFNYPLVQA